MIMLLEVRARRLRFLPFTRTFTVTRNYQGARAQARKRAQTTAQELVRAGALRVRVFELFGEYGAR